MTTLLADLAKIIIPAALVLYGMYLTIRSFLSKDFQRRLTEIKLKHTETILTSRLQAYERMCLFLERITPPNMLVRINPSEFITGELQQIMLHEVRNEFAHNLSQQVYMSNKAWDAIKKAKEEIITLINNTAMQLPEEAKGLEFAKLILENMREYNIDPTTEALNFIKEEIQELF
ncbi:MAG: hypothetical protein ACFB0B_10430 [Thermonemataceae bacterium]